MSDLVFLGQVIRPHGIRGGLKVKVTDDRPDRFHEGQTILAIGPGKKEAGQEYQVKSYSEDGLFGILYFEECQDPDGAEALRDYSLYLDRADLSDLPDNRFYVLDLEGLDVVNEEGLNRGRVESVMSTWANDVLAIHYRGQEILVPFVKAFIREVNLKNHRIVIHEWEGLFDEN